MHFQDYESYGEVEAYVLVYSITDRDSYQHALDMLYEIRRNDQRHVAIIMVANKSDLVRSRQVTETGKYFLIIVIIFLIKV